MKRSAAFGKQRKAKGNYKKKPERVDSYSEVPGSWTRASTAILAGVMQEVVTSVSNNFDHSWHHQGVSPAGAENSNVRVAIRLYDGFSGVLLISWKSGRVEKVERRAKGKEGRTSLVIDIPSLNNSHSVLARRQRWRLLFPLEKSQAFWGADLRMRQLEELPGLEQARGDFLHEPFDPIKSWVVRTSLITLQYDLTS